MAELKNRNNNMNLSQHPLSAAFPAMSADDFQALKDDIKINGQRQPIIVLDGMVLDGWHRYRACVDLGVEARQFTFPVQDDPVALVESANLHRRHLTASQRAAAIVAVREWAPPSRPSAPGENKGAAAAPLSTNKEMAKTANVSIRTIKDAKAGHKAGLTDAMKEGALTAEKAARIARGKPARKAQPAKKATPGPQEPPLATPAPTLRSALDDAREPTHILTKENKHLSELAVDAMNASVKEKSLAKETIEALRAEVKTLTAELSAVKASRDGAMREVAKLKRQCAAQRRQLEKRVTARVDRSASASNANSGPTRPLTRAPSTSTQLPTRKRPTPRSPN